MCSSKVALVFVASIALCTAIPILGEGGLGGLLGGNLGNPGVGGVPKVGGILGDDGILGGLLGEDQNAVNGLLTILDLPSKDLQLPLLGNNSQITTLLNNFVSQISEQDLGKVQEILSSITANTPIEQVVSQLNAVNPSLGDALNQLVAGVSELLRSLFEQASEIIRSLVDFLQQLRNIVESNQTTEEKEEAINQLKETNEIQFNTILFIITQLLNNLGGVGVPELPVSTPQVPINV
ncbi:SXP/RAL-2 family protein Ani s 5-like cation-binding domain-containing protein [Caenorhabditis elegans]|uniref:SXP/RAL-2 family protein Ani s 5-like cation-binding domain-containing protein n=1 Tax=Caenorhabditis elegans TaxID=6239 RepID=A0A0K3AVU8_CAEEL|nr:SXP/RAL-2 family protein Ani s 5-like cation-binding domain-containing protein [Caenorhabditis elegans]CTQ86882.1 SXP/RAL-2 family protein Ani s 5-like cation-binding domain-containing protein [Caenorhabditis elegans]|eukprot:NP_001300183.1 Uncharacterized protein CELE_T02B11.12 [Caenorhabditis elegans]